MSVVFLILLLSVLLVYSDESTNGCQMISLETKNVKLYAVCARSCVGFISLAGSSPLRSCFLLVQCGVSIEVFVGLHDYEV